MEGVKPRAAVKTALTPDFTPGSICSNRCVMDDLRNSLHNLEKEVYRHFMEIHSVPLRAQKGRADDRDSAYDSVNFGVPVPETGDVSDTAPDMQASEHDEAMEG